MHAWEAIQNAVDYIEDHLQEELQTEQLAVMVSLSPFYFQRLFKRLVNKSVQEYIRLRRLARVTEELNQNSNRILDIALDYGFSSHANFSRAFRDAYGITPETYRKTRPMLNTVIKPELRLNYILADEGVPLIIGNIVLEIRKETLKEPETYIGFSADVNMAEQTPIGETTGIDVPGQLWGRFHSEKSKLSEYIDPYIELGLLSTPDFEKGNFQYFAGSLLNIHIPSIHPYGDFIQKELPAGDYIVCKLEAESFESLVTTALDQATKYIYSTWLPKHHLSSKPFSAEKYFKNCDFGNCMEIWVKPETTL